MIPPHCTLALQAMMCLIASSPAEGQRPAKAQLTKNCSLSRFNPNLLK